MKLTLLLKSIENEDKLLEDASDRLRVSSRREVQSEAQNEDAVAFEDFKSFESNEVSKKFERTVIWFVG